MADDAGALLTWARATAARYLDAPEFQDRRWRHVQAAGAKAETIAGAFGSDGELLSASVWVHDIGYAKELQQTGFHPLDGGRCLDSLGADRRLSSLVANHSGAALEAELRGLVAEMQPFPDDADAVRDALWAVDMTTSPVGEPVDFGTRLREITERYGPDHTVPRAISASADEIRAAIRRTVARTRAVGIEVEFGE
jgi:hypothetical protein